MKFAFMAQTNYQLINMIKFVYFNCENAKGNSVLFIRETLVKGIKKIDLLKEMGLFCAIYVYREKVNSQNILLRKASTVLDILNKKAFGHLLIDQMAVNEKFDVLIVPSVSLESQMFWLYFEHDWVYLIEDGLGSTTGNIVKDGMRKGRQYLSNKLYGNFSVDKMYVNNMKFNDSSTDTDKREIPGGFTEDFCKLLTDLYLPSDYDETYHEYDAIYLQQPVSIWSEDYIGLEDKVLQECADVCGELLIIRCHPLTLKNPRLNGVRYDNDNYPWEIVCAEQISHKNILIGIFSTAQFSPKQLYDKEPFMIFLFKLLPPTNVNEASEWKVYELLKNSYKDPERVTAPQTIQELREILTRAKDSSQAINKGMG